jgi:hypothetical protein
MRAAAFSGPLGSVISFPRLGSASRAAFVVEGAAWIAALAFLLFGARSAFFLGTSTIGHDNLFWFYPIYQFFAENVLQGRFPYWDPYSHGGRAFYPLVLQLRLLEPSSFAVLILGKLFTTDLITLFNWDRLARGMVGALGTWVLLRQYAMSPLTRVLLPFVLLWSSFVLALFQQTAVIDQYLAGPWSAAFFLRIAYAGDLRWRNWLGLALFLGAAWQSYYFVGAWLLLLFLAVGLLVFRRDVVVAAFRAQARVIWTRGGLAAGVLALMTLPNAVVFAEREHAVFPARMLDHSYVGRLPQGGPLQYEPDGEVVETGIGVMTYGAVEYTGTFSTVWDFLQLLAPDGNRHIRDKDLDTFGEPSEAFMYVGLLGYVAALVGIAVARHPLKRVWMFVTVAFGVLMLGPAGGLHRLLWILPPMWIVRHTHTFVSFFVLGLLYFVVLGVDRVSAWAQGARFANDAEVRGSVAPGRGRSAIELVTLTIGLFIAVRAFIAITARSRTLPIFNWEALLLVVVLVALVWATRRYGAIAIVAVIFTVHVATVFTYASRLWPLGWRFFLVLLVPVGMVLAVRHARLGLRKAAVGVAALVLLVDLALYVQASSSLWGWVRPDHVLGISVRPQRPVFPETRVVTVASQALDGFYPQSIRYLSLVTRQAAAFASPMFTADRPESYFVRAPFASAGCDSNGVKDTSTVELSPGTTRLVERCVVDSPASLPAGKHVWGHVQVKSSNRASGAIDVELRIGARAITRAYGNSGQWEDLALEGRADGGDVAIIYRVHPSATASATFRNPSLRSVVDAVAVGNRFDLEHIRSSPRWNSFLIPRRYFDLVHAPLPPSALAEILGIGRSLLQYRSVARSGGLADLVATARGLEPQSAARWFDERVYIEGPEQRSEPARSGSSGPADVRLERYGVTDLSVHVEAPTPGFLYVIEGFDRHWKAQVNHASAPVLPANVAFMAVPLPAGASTVDLRYDPLAFRAALCVYFGLIVVISTLAVGSVALSFLSFRWSRPSGERVAGRRVRENPRSEDNSR